MAAGSIIFSLASLLTISLLVLLVLRYYLPLRTTPAYLLIPVFLSLALPSCLVLLAPIDLASHAASTDETTRGITLDDRVLLVCWRIAYWLIFGLTWLILPLLGEYVDSGYREPRDRMIYSLRTNGFYQALTLGAGAVVGIYFFWSSGFSMETVKGLVMALAYGWGLILAIYLMGHGLVALPRKMFRNASTAGRLKRLQAQAPRVHDKLMDAVDGCNQYEVQVLQLRQRKTGTAREFQEWIEELAESAGLPESGVQQSAASAGAGGSGVPTVITKKYLGDLGRRLKRARHMKMRYQDEWEQLVTAAIENQAILDSSSSKKLEFPNSQPSFLTRWHILTPRTRYIIHTSIIPALSIASGIIFAISSFALVWSELVKSFTPKLSLVGLTVVHFPGSSKGEIGFFGQLIAALWLVYMITAALTSMTEVKIWGNRALVRRNTYGESACWYGCQVAKLTVPLAYNFITFLPPNIHMQATFYKFLGKLIDITPISGGFSRYFPMVILVPVLAALFNLYGKIRNITGFGDMMADEEGDGDDPTGLGGWREGKMLIDREVQGRGLGRAAAGGHSGARDSVGLAPTRASLEDSSSSSRSSHVAGPHASRVSRPTGRRTREERERLLDEDDERVSAISGAGGAQGWFDDFSHRVKNTIDTSDLFKKPAWMGGGVVSGSGSGNDGGEGRGWAGLFGGRPSEGRVRL